MHTVYIIKSTKYPTRLYKGYTTNLSHRLHQHNSGQITSTTKHKPWQIIFYANFKNKTKATEFEKYLKSGSGIAFMRKRLI